MRGTLRMHSTIHCSRCLRRMEGDCDMEAMIRRARERGWLCRERPTGSGHGIALCPHCRRPWMVPLHKLFRTM